MARRGLSLALLGLVLAGCQTLPPPVPDQAPRQQSLSVPFYPQERYQCGPAALAMMLGWAEKPASPSSLVDEVWLLERQGSLLIEMQAAARARGLLVYPVDTPQRLFRELDAGHPVLVMQNLGLEIWPRWHFAVAKGYRDNGSEILLHSGTRENTTSHWNRFIRTWARARYRGFVALPPGTVPADAEPTRLVRALEDLRESAGPEKALAHWETIGERWNDEYLVQFAWGNLLWQQEQRQQALKRFLRATELKPDAAAAWNNLAEAWLQLGCPDKALQPAEKAAALAPENPAVGDTLKKVRSAQGESGTCSVSEGASSG